jgi:hypothetical protein
MTNTGHSNADQVDAAVNWIIDNPPGTRKRATVPLLQEFFGLSAMQAIEAIRSANAKRHGLEAQRHERSR